MAASSRASRALLAAALAALLPGAAAAQRPVSEAPYVPTPMEVVHEMLALAAPGPDDVVYDLGSGDGRIPIEAARLYGARGVGIDLDARLVQRAEENAREAGVAGRVRFVHGDLFAADLRPATVVTLYLPASVNLKLRPILLEQLRPGTRVVSHSFSMGDWAPDSMVTVRRPGAEFGPRVFFWVVPAKVGGSWSVMGPGGERYALRLRQEFQRVEGTVRAGGRELPLRDVKLVGDRITFTLPEAAGGSGAGRRFAGRVEGDRIQGTLEGETGAAWGARRMP
ncbi:MAG TPA: methyltransferase domain-containing protein [Longimicrobiaceae bacterium]|nr:methyltransferase domain-containing protein [Longimicrobiaceae bacterium]